MKFYLFVRTIFALILIISVEVSSTNENISKKNILNMRTKKIEEFPFKNEKKNGSEDEYKKMNLMKENNPIIINSEVLIGKPPTDKDDYETQVFPKEAKAGSEFKWGFLWWSMMYFPASNAFKMNSDYWLSKRGVKNDFWEAIFEVPQKIDVIDIHWRLAPKRFRVFFKVNDNGPWTPATEVYEKTQFVNREGKIATIDAVSTTNAIVFNKPIFAKRIRFNLNEPIKKSSFSISTVGFYQKRTTLIIKNELFNTNHHYCFFANTSLPRSGSKVQAYPCLRALTMANNNEMWIYYNDSSVRHYNSKLCLGFNVENELSLRNCGNYNPAFTLKLRKDNSLYFTGYEEKCIILDDSQKISNNFISEKTEILITTQADNQSFKKENILMTGENFWHSAPGQKKATIQVLFGKITSGSHKGKYETKKVDLIKINWIKEPKKFLVYTWRPGYSWILRQSYENYKNKVSEIEIIGEEIAAIMLVLEEPHTYPELGNIPAYAISHISATDKSMKLKMDNCANYLPKLKVFDFDTQNYHKLHNSADYNAIRKKISITYEKLIDKYTHIRFTLKYIQKSKMKAENLINKLLKMRKNISDETVKKLRNFKSEILSQLKNANFVDFLKYLKQEKFINSIVKRKSQGPILGTKEMPGRDCLSIKKLIKNSLSGWFYIKPECAPKAMRVFCDFTIVADATDIFIFNDDSSEPNPDLSYLGFKDFNSVRFQCAKLGLFPIEVKNRETVNRIYQILTVKGYDLSKPIVVPLGYDYTCVNGKCAGIVNSINDKQSSMITEFFQEAGKRLTKGLVKSGPFAGLGYSNNASMIKFDANSVRISALICSTNHFKTDTTDTSVKTISCDLNPARNGGIFTEGSSVLVDCPSSCEKSKSPIYGTNMFHLKSSVCKAAIHASVLTTEGGKVYVRISRPLPKYLSSISNGITSQEYNLNDGMNSFTLIKYEPKCPISQFEELVKTEKLMENISEIGASSPSSFFETSATVYLSQVKEKFELDLKSNELEGVELEDIKKAGVRVNKENLSNHIDYTEKNENNENNIDKSNKSDILNDNNNISNGILERYDDEIERDPSFSAVNDEMIRDVNSLVNYNKENGMNNEFDINNVDYDQNESSYFKFSEKEEEGQVSEPIIQKRDRLTSQNVILPQTNTNIPITQKRDRLTSIDTQRRLVNNIKSASDNIMNNVNNISTANTNNSIKVNSLSNQMNKYSQPSGDNINTNNSSNDLQSGQTQPALPDAPKPKSNNTQNSNTDDGNKIMMKIRKTVDWNYLENLITKLAKIKKELDEYNKKLSWSNEGSKLSISFLQRNLMYVQRYRTKVLQILRRLSDEALSRVIKTKKLKYLWRGELNKLESKDVFKIDYSLSTDILLRKVMTIIDMKGQIKSNWNILKEGLKDKARAIGVTSKIYTPSHLMGSVLKVNGREFFDFDLNVDVLVKSNGIAGVAFRMKDQFNYYAFYINKLKGWKALAKVVNGKVIDLQRVTDGGILVNNWHRINIKAHAGKIRVFIYDAESPNKTTSEKVFEAVDNTYSSGTVGFFVNGMEGFYFDNLIVNPNFCWTAWTPMKNLNITLPLSSVYHEDFTGNLEPKYMIVDPEDLEEGPSIWVLNQNSSPGKPFGLVQNSECYDKSSLRKPSMLLARDILLSNGNMSVTFTPLKQNGIISIIFKYSKDINGETYYSFDMISSKANSQLLLRRYNNGISKEIKAVNKPIENLSVLGYKAKVRNTVVVEVKGERIKIRMSINGAPQVKVIDATDSSIATGLVGMGTYKVKCAFSRFEVFPPELQVTEADKMNILNTESDMIFIPYASGINRSLSSAGAIKKKRVKINGGAGLSLIGGSSLSSSSSESTSSDSNSLDNISKNYVNKKDSILNYTAGWKTCLSFSTTYERKNYCERTFPIEGSREKCKNEFCETCCEENVEKTHLNVMHICRKSCNKSTSAETTLEYKSVCFNSQNPLTSVYQFCENKLNELDSKKTCKIDMCRLCCSTMDSIKHKNFSLEMINKCFEDCDSEFNK